MKPSECIQRTMAESFGVGVTTNTTDTLTPTTFRTITQLFESDDCLVNLRTMEDDRGFIPPAVVAIPTTTASNGKTYVNLDVSKTWGGGTTTIVTPTNPTAPEDLPTTIVTEAEQPTVVQQIQQQTPSTIQTRSRTSGRTRGGRQRPIVAKNGQKLSAEEEQKIRIRRERNKMAAARCRKRRMDQISTLSEEVDVWENKKRDLQDEIQQLRQQKEELEFLLQAHRSTCKIDAHRGQPTDLVVAIKSEPVVVEAADAPYQLTSSKPRRPATLQLPPPMTKQNVEGVTIDTPSSIFTALGFDLSTVSTGLTPVSNIITPVFSCGSLNTPTGPSCSSQQRSSEDLSNNNVVENTSQSLVSL